MTDAKKPAESDETDGGESAGETKKKKGSTTAKTEKPDRKRDTGKKLAAGANALRDRIATVVWLVAVVCALFLAVGALLVAVGMNQQNAIVAFITDGARTLDFGTFKEFTGKGAGTKSALTNWGIAAIIYLVVGKVLDRIIRP